MSPNHFAHMPLPTETLMHIVEMAWLADCSPVHRAFLFKRLSASCTTLRTIALRVVLRHLIIDVKSGYSDDLDIYRSLVNRAAHPQHTPDPADHPTHLFGHSDLHLCNFTQDFCSTAWSQDHHRPAIRRRNDLFRFLQDVVGDCRTFTLSYSHPRSLNPASANTVKDLAPFEAPHLLFSGPLRHFASLTTVYLDCSWPERPDPKIHVTGSPLPVLPSVRTLRLRALPTCPSYGGLRCVCVLCALPTTFPALATLHVERARALRALVGRTPPDLRTLVVDAPPAVPRKKDKHAAGKPPAPAGPYPHGTLEFVELPAALEAGLLRPPAPHEEGGGIGRLLLLDEPRARTVVVRSGRGSPAEFDRAAAACAKHGVALVRKVVQFEAEASKRFLE
ncbi:uncharacterized protein BXZ73DRAFT_108144 [Epithele typhae]|uniref:uncharacterized protein n=1 Tax=Epithele typhae TaxID=378194 RepID=UPI0020081B36|nr:uncharacterized protein BXZ73DRAFT_108144 [Epithele typhae]KAH9911277.1 hypothetical protein BXZ73DRAFT_108144 [Epithele typhae]